LKALPGARLGPRQAWPHLLGAGLVLCVSSACEPELVVGKWQCPPPAAAADGGVVALLDKVVDPSWTTGFESTGFCDYSRAGGFCYGNGNASYTVVEAPVHGGKSAAAFSISLLPEPSDEVAQARCFREGALPSDAMYGAWFYLPALASNTGNWNLIHFEGGAPGAGHGLWDVSLRSEDDGSLSLYLFDFLRNRVRLVPDAALRSVPIGAWFHVELRLRRAADATGEVALYQDGALLMELVSLATDDTDWAQWYVGNLADALTPTDSTLYVDDVTIRALP